jgi:hypothetical protein
MSEQNNTKYDLILLPDDDAFVGLVYACLDDCITSEQADQIKALLQNDKHKRDLFVQICMQDQMVYEVVGASGSAAWKQNEQIASSESLFWQELSREEKTAPEVEVIEPADMPREIIKTVKINREPYRISGSFWFAMTSIAALVLMLVYLKFTPSPYSRQVATLVDAINVQWKDSSVSHTVGSRLFTNEGPIQLKKGIIKIKYDEGVEVVIEGPAEYEIVGSSVISLNYGCLYTRVNESGRGFIVDTLNSRIMDMGTEFGVQASSEGNAELHVFSGEITLISGAPDASKNKQFVTEGSAKYISRTGEIVNDILLRPSLFVRDIHSATRHIWRGEMKINLADIVGGGNGLGTRQPGEGINPLTGKIGTTAVGDREGNGRYMPVPASPYIDGVFVPDDRNAPVIVSSKGHIFTDCPKTNNIFFFEIMNGVGVLSADSTEVTLLGGRVCGTPDYPSLMMHANLGITFDLNAIRADLPEAEITRFAADAGLSSLATREEGNADVWVLVDGKLRFSRKGIREKGKAFSIEVDIKKSDRFLTLVTTDGGDVDYPAPGMRATDSDWCIFAEPRLELSLRQNK